MPRNIYLLLGLARGIAFGPDECGKSLAMDGKEGREGEENLRG